MRFPSLLCILSCNCISTLRYYPACEAQQHKCQHYLLTIGGLGEPTIRPIAEHLRKLE